MKVRVKIERPDGKCYYVKFPKDEKNDNNLLTWVEPMEVELTKRYYEEIKFDLINNIKVAIAENNASKAEDALNVLANSAGIDILF